MGTVSDATPNAGELLKHWVLDLRLGNEITADGWAEIRATIAKLPENEKEGLRGMVLDFLVEVDHGRN